MADVATEPSVAAAPTPAHGERETVSVVSQRFGTFDVPADSVLYFEQGVIGFPENHRFVILEHRPGSPFKWMLSLDDPELGFAIANPTELVAGYEPPFRLASRVLDVAESDIALFVIVTIPSDPQAMTVNLMAPVVVDMRTRRARQVVLEGSKLDPRHQVFSARNGSGTDR